MSISRARVAWLYPSSRADSEPWPLVRASGRADASTDRGAREPRRARRASDTWCESSSDTRLHRATSHKQRLENDPGNVLRVDTPEPHPVPPGGVRVPAKAATRSPREQKSYGHPGSKRREAYTELGKQRWCRRRSLARRPQPSGFLLRVLLRNRVTQQRSHFFLDVDDDVRLRLLVRCVVCTPLCRSAASLWQLLRDPAAKPAPDRRPLWLPLHSAAARQEASLHSPYAKGSFQFERVVTGWRASSPVLDLRLK